MKPSSPEKPETGIVNIDKILFLPIGVVSGLVAGQIGKRLFALVWKMVDDEEAPKPQIRDVDYGKLVLALVLEGAVFNLIRGLSEHGIRQSYARLTGSWPGDEQPEPS